MSNTDTPATPRIQFGGLKKENTMSNVDNESNTEVQVQDEAFVAEAQAQNEATTEAVAENMIADGDTTESHQEVAEVAENSGVEVVEDVGQTTVPAVGVDPAEDSVQQVAVAALVESDPNELADQSLNEVLSNEPSRSTDGTVPFAQVEQTDTKADEAVSADTATDKLHNSDAEGGKSLEELRAEQEAVAAQIKAKQDAQKNSVLEQIKSVVTTYNISTTDLVAYLGGLPRKSKGTTVAQKYKDPASNATWSGRGRAPAWIAGQDRTKYLITQS